MSKKTDMKKEYSFTKSKRGSVIPPQKGKTRITIRLDDDVLDWFREQVNKSGGGSYQTMINQALRKHLELASTPKFGVVRWGEDGFVDPWQAIRAFENRLITDFEDKVENKLRRVIKEEFKKAAG